jgi:hypothetical protein
METASWVFVTLLIAFLMGIVGYREIFGTAHPVHRNTQMLLGVMCALLAGFAGFFLTGKTLLSWELVSNAAGRITVQATAGSALFIFVMWWWRAFPPIPEDQTEIRKDIVVRTDQLKSAVTGGDSFAVIYFPEKDENRWVVIRHFGDHALSETSE